MPPFMRRLLLNILPLFFVVGAISYTLMGEEGLLNRSALKQQLFATKDRVEVLQTDNDQLRSQIRSLREDPDAVKRLAAERLFLAEEGSTIYRFDN